MSTIEQEMNGDYMEQGTQQDIPQLEGEVQQRKGIDFSFLSAPTGDGAIEDYLDHPMNFNNSKGVARIIRGFTGMFGSLNYALVDIVLGALDLSPKKGAEKHDNNRGIGISG